MTSNVDWNCVSCCETVTTCCSCKMNTTVDFKYNTKWCIATQNFSFKRFQINMGSVCVFWLTTSGGGRVVKVIGARMCCLNPFFVHRSTNIVVDNDNDEMFEALYYRCVREQEWMVDDCFFCLRIDKWQFIGACFDALFPGIIISNIILRIAIVVCVVVAICDVRLVVHIHHCKTKVEFIQSYQENVGANVKVLDLVSGFVVPQECWTPQMYLRLTCVVP